jgi:hypothetical protein
MRNENVKPDPDAPLRLEELLCRRTGRKIPPAEHELCPYCFGRAAEVANGQYERFCDYVPGRDPVHFGFPAGTTRDLEG